MSPDQKPSRKTLIFVPTYNERENAPLMCAEIHRQGLDADVLFVDDASPDGTGEALEKIKPEFPRLIVHHRSGKLGIGSAHLDGIKWAYEQGYDVLVTLDCDFTHSPSDIPAMIAAAESGAIAVGSRWLKKDSLPGWNVFRRAMTNLGHVLTRRVLGLPHDASGAFRAYRLAYVPQEIFSLVKSMGYSFFFESLFIMYKNGLPIADVPIVLPARTYGSSKMTTSAAFRSARYVFELSLHDIRRPEQFLLPAKSPDIDPGLIDPQKWDDYWKKNAGNHGLWYDLIAGFYRQNFIKRNIEQAIFGNFPEGSRLLHAGCGSGQADTAITKKMRVTALDISPQALELYARNNGNNATLCHGSIFKLPFPDGSFDGYYSMGVVEHFTPDEIRAIFAEARRALKPDGKLVIFWPHKKATSVFVLGLWHWIINNIFKKDIQLHPPEISLVQNSAHARGLMEACGLRMLSYHFGAKDLFIQAVVIAKA